MRKEIDQFMWYSLACEHVNLDFHQCATRERIWNIQNQAVESHFKVRGEA
jgi:hypothetical protein